MEKEQDKIFKDEAFDCFLTYLMKRTDSLICSANSFPLLMKCIDAWKELPSTRKRYKVEPYNRMIYSSNDNFFEIDFGDYTYFLKVTLPSGVTAGMFFDNNITKD